MIGVVAETTDKLQAFFFFLYTIYDIPIYIYIHTYMHTYICIHMYVYACMHVCMYIYIYSTEGKHVLYMARTTFFETQDMQLSQKSEVDHMEVS